MIEGSKGGVNWRVVFWVAVMFVFLWLVGKEIGLIKVPVWVGVLPYAGGFFALLAFLKEGGKLVQKLERVVVDIGDIRGELRDLRGEIHNVHLSIAHVDKRVAIIEVCNWLFSLGRLINNVGGLFLLVLR